MPSLRITNDFLANLHEIGLSRVFIDYKFFKGGVFVRKIGHMEIQINIPFDALPFLVLVFELAPPNSFVFLLDTFDTDCASGIFFLDTEINTDYID